MVTKLKGLWLRCFADSEEDVDYFLERRFQSCGSMVAMEDGEIVGMVFLLPAKLAIERENKIATDGKEASYIYAFATHPDFRGRGIATNLLDEVRRRNREKGILTFLCPAEESLVSFYEKRGFYQSFFASVQEASLSAGEGLNGWKSMAAGQRLNEAVGTVAGRSLSEMAGTVAGRSLNEMAGTVAGRGFDGNVDACAGRFCLEGCSPLEYAAIRVGYLRDGDIAWDENAVRYAVEENSHSGGECRKVLLPDGQKGAVLIGIQEECLKLREVLLPEKFILEEKGYLQGLAARIAIELASERGITLRHWQAVMPGRSRDNGKKLMGMSDEPGIRGYLNLVLD